MNGTSQTHHNGPGTANAPSGATEARAGRFHPPSVNITPGERLGRVAVGSFAAVAGAFLLTGAASPLAVTLEVLLIVTGLDLVGTGALGHCPLYQRLGYVPRSLRRTQ